MMNMLPSGAIPPTPSAAAVNGISDHEPTMKDLERELPVVYDGQIPLGDLLSRVMQAIYAELTEMAETLPNMSDSARKRTLADWVVRTKKQVVKLYASAKWARDADVVQKCMNITAFLMNQNQQFQDAICSLNIAKENLDSARLRNHDLLTSLDVLTTGSYRRLPSGIKKMFIKPNPMSDAEIKQTLTDVEDTIRYRLCMSEIIPVEMAQYRIADGRVYFIVPKLFETSLCLRGALRDDGWFFVHVEFLLTAGGDSTGIEDFPREPTGIMKRFITEEADTRLGYYLPPLLDMPEPVPRPSLPEGTVDAPLVRLFNFLQMMSFSYQLEMLMHQAERMRSLGWAEYLTVNMSSDRKILTVSYWIRSNPPVMSGRNRPRLPSFGGSLTVAIVKAIDTNNARPPKLRTLAELQQRSKLELRRPSDETESLRFGVTWEPMKLALGVVIPPEESEIVQRELTINSDNLDFEALLRKAIDRHIKSILNLYQFQLQHGPARTVFSPPGMVTLLSDANVQALRIHLCATEVVILTIEARTGRFSLRDTGDLAAAGRGLRFDAISDRINENPALLFEALLRLRLVTITELAEQKAKYLGLQSFRQRNFSPEEVVAKLGPMTRGVLYIQLANFPTHYLVLVITDEGFRYALITVKVMTESMYANLVMEDIAWLDSRRMCPDDPGITGPNTLGDKWVTNSNKEINPIGFDLDTQTLRELYSYCCARVAYMNVERQFKLRGIPFTHVNPSSSNSSELAHIQSSLARSVPALCVQSKHILSGAPAAEAAMPNIRVIPLNWWSEKSAQVVTCVKLKYVQQPMGKTAVTSTVIRPSKRIIYDTTEAVVSFLSENVNTCVDEFLEEWARVSKMVVIAREVAQMAKDKKWSGVRLLSFDLQTVEFAYAEDYAVSITCTDQLSPTGGNFDLRFSRSPRSLITPFGSGPMLFNPHDDAEPFLCNILRQGHGRLAPSLHRLVGLLRDTLPIAVALEEIRQSFTEDGPPNAIANVDTFAKAATWYRILYGDLRHALDFRLMADQRVLILDGSFSLYDGDLHPSTKLGISSTESKEPEEPSALQRIPNMKEAVLDAVRDAHASDPSSICRVAPVDVGLVCDGPAVKLLSKALHSQLLRRLRPPS